jgi:hypothetical protein
MGPKTTRLVGLLDSAVQLLHSVDETHWSSWLQKDATLMKDGDFYGVQHFLGAFGGMGSINDLMIHPINGYRIAETDAAKVNETLQALLSQAYDLAQEIRRERMAG